MAEKVSAVLLQQVFSNLQDILVMKEGKVTHLLVNGSFSTSSKEHVKAKGGKSVLHVHFAILNRKLCILRQYTTSSQLINATVMPQVK